MMKRTFKHLGKSIASAARPAISGLLAFIMLFGTIPAPAYAEMIDEAARAVALAQAEDERVAAEPPSDEAPTSEASSNGEVPVKPAEPAAPDGEAAASETAEPASNPAPASAQPDSAPAAQEPAAPEPAAPAPEPGRLVGDFAESDDLVYASVQGDAPVSEDAVANAIDAVDGVDAGKAREAATNLMNGASGIDMAAVPQGPQAQLKMTWITPDDEQNNNDDLLYLKPGSNRDPIGFRLSFAFYGDSAFEAGQLVIKLPRTMFKCRNGASMGALEFPVPQDPSNAATWNWRLMKDGYEIVNTRRLDAVTRGFMEFSLSGIYPLEIVDQAVTEPYSASVELPGATDSVSSNALQVQVDTHARPSTVSVWSSKPQILGRNHGYIPGEALNKWPKEKQFVQIRWASNMRLSANQPYTIKGTAQFGVENHDEIVGVISDRSASDTVDVYDPVDSTADRESPVFDSTVTYPLSAFKPGAEYIFTDVAKMNLTEKDPAVPGDPQESSDAVGYGKCSWSYYEGKFREPEAGVFLDKYGNSNVALPDNGHLCRDYYGVKFSDLSVIPSSLIANTYGYYPDGAKALMDNKPVELSYTMLLGGRFLPLTYKEPVDLPSGVDGKRFLENYGKVPVTIQLDESGLSAVDDGLRLGVDYAYSNLMFPKRPEMRKAVRKNLDKNGEIIDFLKDATFDYAVDRGAVAPDMKVSVKLQGEWKTYATVSWKTGKAEFDVEKNIPGTPEKAVDGCKLNLPEGVQDIRVSATTTAAGMSAHVRVGVKLLPSPRIKELAEHVLKDEEFSFRVYNKASLEVFNDSSKDKKTWLSETASGYDVFQLVDVVAKPGRPDYDEGISVYARKSASHTVDDQARIVKMKYTASVDKKTGIADQQAYEKALADGKLSPEKSGVWYDLLPKGVVVDLASVKLREGDRIDALYTIEDYKQTGRTLLVVKATLNPVTVKMGNHFGDRISISFDATYSLADAFAYGFSPHNVIAFQSNNEALGTVGGFIGEPDDPRSNNNQMTRDAFAGEGDAVLDAMTDLDGDGKHGADESNTFVYAGCTSTVVNEDLLHWATTGLSKSAMVNNDGVWDAGTEKKLDVFNGGFYSYRLGYTTAEATEAKGLVFYDKLDGASSADEKSWRGAIAGIDLTMLEGLGCKPVVYYTTEKNLTLVAPDGSQNADHTSLSKGGVWTRTTPGELASMPFKDRRAITGIAVDARKDQKGAEFILPGASSVTVTISMIAPRGHEARLAIQNQAKARNTMCLAYRTSADSGISWSPVEFDESNGTVVGMRDLYLRVTKSWDDDGDRDGKRPTRVEVQLQANGKNVYGQVRTLDAKGGWDAVFNGLSYTDEEGRKNVYTVQEIDRAGLLDAYESGYSFDGSTIALTNHLIPERVTVSGVKTWSGDSEAERPTEIVVDLYKGSKKIDSMTVKPSADGTWRYAFENLYKYQHGSEIEYSVRESADSAPLYEHSVEGYDLHNQYHPCGDLAVSKIVHGATAVVADKSFPVSVLFSKDGEPLSGTFDYIVTKDGAQVDAGTMTSGKQIWLTAGQKLVIKDLPANVEFYVSEVEPAGFSFDSQSSVISGTVKPNQVNSAPVVSRYSTVGIADFGAVKRLTGRELIRSQFMFEFRDSSELLAYGWNERPEGAPVVNEHGEIVSEAKISIPSRTFSGEDHGKEYRYFLREIADGYKGYTCDNSVYNIIVRPVDNGDGTMRVDVNYLPLPGGEFSKDGTPLFRNAYSASVSTELTVEKQLEGGKLTADQFTFEYGLVETDEAGATTFKPLGTAKNNAEGIVTFPLKYTQRDVGKEFTYAIHEVVGDEPNLIYDDHYALARVTVKDLGAGALAADTVYKGFEITCFECGGHETPGVRCAVCHGRGELLARSYLLYFENEYKPGGITIKKTLDPTADPNTPPENFLFKLELHDDRGRPVQWLDFKDSQYVEVADPAKVKREPQADAPSLASALDAASGFFKGLFAPEEAYAAPVNPSGTPTHQGVSELNNYAWAFYEETGTLQIWQDGADPIKFSAENNWSSSKGDRPDWVEYGVPAYKVKHVVIGREDSFTEVQQWDEMFYNHSHLKDIRGINCRLWNIGKNAFKQCWEFNSFDLASFKLSNPNTDIFVVSDEAFGLTNFSASELVFELENDNQTLQFGNAAFSGTKIGKIRVTNAKQIYMGAAVFKSMPNLTTVDFGTSKVYGQTYYSNEQYNNFDEMFKDCTSLQSIDLSHWVFPAKDPQNAYKSNVYANRMFANCTALTQVSGLPSDVKEFTEVDEIFLNCTALKELYWPGFKRTYFGYRMFQGCSSLEVLDLSGWDPIIGSYLTHDDMLLGCTNLKKLRMPSMENPLKWSGFNSTFAWKRIDEATGEMLAGLWTASDLRNQERWVKGTYVIHTDINVRYDKNASNVVTGMPEPSSVTFDMTKPMVVSDQVPERVGCKFTGWRAAGKIVQPGGTIPFDVAIRHQKNGLVLEAQWEQLGPSGSASQGTYYFNVKPGWQLELSKIIPAGTSYRVSELTKDGWKLVAATGDMGYIEPGENKVASFVNAPLAAGQITPVSVSLTARKTVDGERPGAWTGFEFSAIEVADAKGAPLPGAVPMSGSMLNDGTIVFGRFNIDKAGKRYFKITETPGDDVSIAYDDREIIATVDVTENAGKLEAKVSYAGGGGNEHNTFENVTMYGQMTISKAIVDAGAGAPDDEFTFALKLGGKTQRYYAYYINGDMETLRESESITLKAGQSATILYPELKHGTSYSVEEVNIPAGWSLSSVPDNAQGVIDRDAPINVTFTNRYTATGTAMLEASKVLENGTLTGGQFTFDVFECDEHGAPVGDPVATAHNDNPDVAPTIPGPDGTEVPNPEFGHAKVLFPDIVCGKPGTQRYAIVERVPADALNADGVRYDRATVDQKNAGAFAKDGIVYDSVIRYADVSATDIGGTLDISVAYVDAAGNPLTDGVVFTNRLEAVSLGLTKRASNATLSALARDKAKFDLTFSLKGTDGAALKGVAYQIVNTGDGTPISKGTVDDGGVVTIGLDQCLLLSGLPYGAAYSVDEKQPAGWVADVPGSIAGTLDGPKSHELASTYSAKGELVITALKRFDRKMSGGEFTFDVLDAADAKRPIRTATNAADGAITFKPIGFTEVDDGSTRDFMVVERPGTDDVVRYDDAVFTVEVKPIDNGDGTMRIEPVIMDEAGKRVTQILFVNGRQFRLPFTGGRGVGLAGVAVLALGCAAYLLDRRRRHA